MRVIITVLACFCLQFAFLYGQEGTPPEMRTSDSSQVISNALRPDEAMAMAFLYTAFGTLPESDSVVVTAPELVSLKDETTPFISEMISSKRLWRVTMRQVPITCGSIQKRRDYEIYLDSASYRLMLVYSASDNTGTADTLPELTAAEYEKNMQGDMNRFGGIPDQPPAMAFARILCSCFDNALDARVIKAAYINYSACSEEPQDMWVVILRGIDPPPLCAGPVEGNVPVNERNSSWNLIDANTGKLLYMMSSPIKVKKLNKK